MQHSLRYMMQDIV